MKKLNSSIIIILTISLFGCAGAGVMATNDPMKKIDQAYVLMNQGRAIIADRLGKEAFDTFSKESNKRGMAETHILFGQLYKHVSYRNSSKHFEAQNEYDPTNKKSISHTEKALEIYKSMGNYTQSAKAQFALANSHVGSNTEEACNLYNESISSYNEGKIKNPGEDFWFNPNFKSFEAMINAFQSKYCSKGA